jgi:hypothetical protein
LGWSEGVGVQLLQQRDPLVAQRPDLGQGLRAIIEDRCRLLVVGVCQPTDRDEEHDDDGKPDAPDDDITCDVPGLVWCT